MAVVVKFLDLACQLTEDNGNDEVYLNYNGARIWGGDDGVAIGQGGAIDLEHLGNFDVDDIAVLTLHDEDWPDSDDFLGEWRINEGEAGQGIRVATFDRDDAHYTLRYKVGRIDF